MCIRDSDEAGYVEEVQPEAAQTEEVQPEQTQTEVQDVYKRQTYNKETGELKAELAKDSEAIAFQNS